MFLSGRLQSHKGLNMSCHLAPHLLSFMCLSILVIPQSASAEGSREEAFAHFSEGKVLYQKRDYQGAEKSFDLSIRQVKDHQSLYYKALSVSKQPARCEDERDAWQTYLTFCTQEGSNCVSSWVPKAEAHLQRAQQRCQRVAAPAPASQATPPVQRPACMFGQAYPGGPCLPAPAPQQATQSSARAYHPQPETSLISSVPWWGYVGGGLGLLSHIINLSTDRSSLLDATYISALSGYVIGGIGVGLGVYRYSTSDQPAQSHSALPNQARSRAYLFTWGGNF